jgi:hypothetical protein
MPNLTPAPPVLETESPEWLETPDLGGYALIGEDSNGNRLQEVEVTREEYDHLKKHLAALRGLPWPEEDQEEAA